MPKKLEIRVGPHRSRTEVAWVNDSSKPTIIDTDLFCGRVLIKIRDFDGVTPDNSPARRDHPYFDKRNRRFDIQIEGRFKARPGAKPYTGDEIQFGSDFDKIVSFPMTPFKLGMRIAKSIDPNTYYDFEPPSGRPFIMSPYLACMNTFCAWPTSYEYKNALVCLKHSSESAQLPPPTDPSARHRPRSTSIQEITPVEASRQAKKYWHFVGLRSDPKISALAQKNAQLFAEDAIPEAGANAAPKRPMPRHQVSFGTRQDRDADMEMANRQRYESVMQAADNAGASHKSLQSAQAQKKSRFSSLTSKFGALTTGSSSPPSSAATSQPARRSSLDDSSPNASEAEDEFTPLPVQHVDTLPLTQGVPELATLSKGDLAWADTLRLPEVDSTDPVAKQLGPWRFENPATEPMEDNTFVFLDQNVAVPKRRKHFSKPATLQDFTYDPDVVYSASFFSPFMDFNTFDLSMGPLVHLNIGKYFTDMPVRYTLRSSRLVPGTHDEEVFVTISFQLVDVP